MNMLILGVPTVRENKTRVISTLPLISTLLQGSHQIDGVNFYNSVTSRLDRSPELKALKSPAMSPTASKNNVTSLEEGNTTSFVADIPPPHPRLGRRNTVVPDKKPLLRPKISPALYATPEPLPIPDSPNASFSPSSPYIINHKRRGPRLLKSFSDQNVAAEDVNCEQKVERLDDEIVNGRVKDDKIVINGSNGDILGQVDEIHEENGEVKVMIKSTEDIVDSLEATSNTDVESYGAERSAKASNTPMGEFFDAWEELSSDSGKQGERSLVDVETELQEMRLTFIMEMEKRKQAEEALNNMCSQWQLLREKLGVSGLILPTDLSVYLGDGQSNVGSIEEICQQIHLARFVSESIGRGFAKAEVEAEMETQLELKNFEIARLWDRLHYYETMNREMSHRNQEAIEMARHERQRKRRRQKWVWGSVGAAITLGCAALTWSYLPARQRSSSFSSSSSTTHTSLESDDIFVQ